MCPGQGFRDNWTVPGSTAAITNNFGHSIEDNWLISIYFSEWYWKFFVANNYNKPQLHWTLLKLLSESWSECVFPLRDKFLFSPSQLFRRCVTEPFGEVALNCITHLLLSRSLHKSQRSEAHGNDSGSCDETQATSPAVTFRSTSELNCLCTTSAKLVWSIFLRVTTSDWIWILCCRFSYRTSDLFWRLNWECAEVLSSRMFQTNLTKCWECLFPGSLVVLALPSRGSNSTGRCLSKLQKNDWLLMNVRCEVE